MVLFSLIITTGIFVRYFIHIGMTWMSILPIAILVALFFGSGIQSSHKSGIKSYVEDHLQSFSWILINIGFLIIMSLYNIGRTLGSLYCIIINAILLGASFIIVDSEWKPALRASIIFFVILYIISGGYIAYLIGSGSYFIALLGMLTGLLAGFRSSYYFIVGYYRDVDKKSLRYELFLIYHILSILIIFKIYLSQDPFTGLIIIQSYIALLLFLLSKAKNHYHSISLSHDDINVEYILRGYKINQIPKKDSVFDGFFGVGWLQDFMKHIPDGITSALSVSSIVTTLLFCGIAVRIGQTQSLTLGDFMLFLINIVLYLRVFYLCKVIGVQDKLWRFIGFIVINICYFIIVAQVFSRDTVSILFRSILRSVSNNIALNYMQELKSYLGKTDYQYWLMSNFFGLLIILYFFLSIPLDVLLKLAFVVMIVGIWLLLNKDNLKAMMEKEKADGEHHNVSSNAHNHHAH